MLVYLFAFYAIGMIYLSQRFGPHCLLILYSIFRKGLIYFAWGIHDISFHLVTVTNFENILTTFFNLSPFSMSVNPNQAGLFWMFYGRGGVESTPPWELGRRSRDRHENLHVCPMWRTLPNCKKKIENFHSFYFILINYANLCIKSLFSSKVINKAAGILIFGVNIPCSILINVLEKKIWYLH